MQNEVRYEKIITEHKSPLKVVKIEIEKENSTARMPKHWHRSIEFILPFENGSEVWIEGENTYADVGEMILVNSREIHECGSLHIGEAYRGYAIQLKYDFLKEVIPNIDQCSFRNHYVCKKNHALFEIIERIIEANQVKNDYHYLKLQSLAYELTYELMLNYCLSIEDKGLHKKTKQKARLVEVLTYLDENAAAPFDALEIADRFHLSYGHLAKLFKTELDMTMKEYVNSVRVRNATFDLLSTDLPIIDIAMQNGFASVKAFYKEFDKVYHMTPKQYRKAEKN